MPQMGPMMWCPLFLYFILLLMMVMAMMYFSSFNFIRDSYSANKLSGLTWKW